MKPSEKGSSFPLNFANQSTIEGSAAGNGGDHNIPGNARQCCHLAKLYYLYHEEALVPAKGMAATCPHHGRVKSY